MTIVRRPTAAIAALLLLAGCESYHPAPADRTAFAGSFDARGLSLPAGRPLDAPSLMAVAIAHAPKVRDAAAAYRTALAAARSARVRPLGTLTLTAEYSHQDNPDKPWLGNATAGIPLDFGGRRSGRIGSADLAALQARYDYVEALWTAHGAIDRGLIEMRAADREIADMQQAVALRREREDRFARRVSAGEDARSAHLLARTDRLAAERRLTDAQARRAQALETLAAAIGLPGTALAGRSIAPLPATAADPAPATVAAWRGDAVLARPDVLRAAAGYDISEAAVRTEVARQYPDIQIGPGYTYERGITKLPFNLTLTLPPADFNRAAIYEAEARRAAAGTAIESAQAAVIAAVDTARTALTAAAAQDRRATQDDLPAAAKTYDQARRSAAAGETDRTDELAAHAALIDSRIAANDARRLHDLARADLVAAARPPLPPEQTAIFQEAMQMLEPKP